MSNRLPVKKNRRFSDFLEPTVPFDAEEGVTNVTSLISAPSASIQQLVIARRRSYDPLWSRSLS